MKAKLREALTLVNELTADLEGNYPIGLLRLRRLIADVMDEVEVGSESVHGDETPPPAA